MHDVCSNCLMFASSCKRGIRPTPHTTGKTWAPNITGAISAKILNLTGHQVRSSEQVMTHTTTKRHKNLKRMAEVWRWEWEGVPGFSAEWGVCEESVVQQNSC